MTDLLIKTLESINNNSFKDLVFRQGSAPAEYPDSFFTFFNFENPLSSHYDNDATRTNWGYVIYFYSNFKENGVSFLDDTFNLALAALKAAGFILTNRGEDIASDEPSHLGKYTEIYYIENL